MKSVKLVKRTKLTDTVKVAVMAGMPFARQRFAGFKIVAYDYYLHTFDTEQKDCLIKSEKIKRVMI